ncbi:alpha/beta fold hydrolase [Embleya sp. NPDC059237]|uniref:alpha/beta fold hydrolase n=1 Tax=Embleya sp. NPDC059237 TaxID=3346784 RepID=UPI00367E1B4E
MSATIVLVHGGFVDGAGWRGVYDALTADGFTVRIVQNPTRSLADDVAVTRNVLNDAPGPVVLVGHSYGGAVITEAGNHDKVAALVYVAAFAPDQGESVDTLLGMFAPDGPLPPILPPLGGYLFLDRGRFADAFAADIPVQEAAFLADSQVPWGLGALGGMVTKAAWRAKPSWYLKVTDDRMIPPAAQAAMARRIGATVVETPGSHAIHVSRPDVVAELVKRAANG